MRKLFLLAIILFSISVSAQEVSKIPTTDSLKNSQPQIEKLVENNLAHALEEFAIDVYNQRVMFGTNAPSGTSPLGKIYNRTSNGHVYGSKNDGTWVDNFSSTSPGGSNTQVQYNSSNTFAGDSGLTYTGTGATGELSIGASVRLGLTGRVYFGSGNNALRYSDGVGLGILDDTTSVIATLNVQSLTANRTFTFPNQSGTFCTTGSVCSGYQSTITFGTGVQAALGVNVGSAGAPVLLNGAGGTPSAITLTNATALPDSALSANVPLLNAANTFTGNTLVSGSSFGLTGAISGAGIFGTSGIRYKNVASTLTDTTSTGTVATNYTNVFGANTLAASSATTITNSFNTYISDPVAGSNVTLTNKWALGADSVKIGTSNQLTVSNAGAINIAGVVTASDANGYQWSSGSSSYKLYWQSGLGPTLSFSGADIVLFDGRIRTGSAKQFVWTDNTAATQGTVDTGLARALANVTKSTNGTTGGGAHMVGDVVGSRPTCSVTIRGAMWNTNATAGNGDIFQVCMKSTSDTYSWVNVFTAP